MRLVRKSLINRYWKTHSDAEKGGGYFGKNREEEWEKLIKVICILLISEKNTETVAFTNIRLICTIYFKK